MNVLPIGIAIVAMWSTALSGPVAPVELAQQQGNCSGCTTIGPTTSDSQLHCLEFSEDIALTAGNCTGTAPNCLAQPCGVSGDIEITNNCIFAVWMTTSTGGSCGAKIEIPPGSSVTVTPPPTIACGASAYYTVSSSDPGSSCPHNGTAGVSFGCKQCAGPPHTGGF